MIKIMKPRVGVPIEAVEYPSLSIFINDWSDFPFFLSYHRGICFGSDFLLFFDS